MLPVQPRQRCMTRSAQGGFATERDCAAMSAGAARRLHAPSAQSRRPRSARCCSARSERLMRRGEPALDVEAEVARLLGTAGARDARSGHRIGGAPAGDRAQRAALAPGTRAARRRRRGRSHARGTRRIAPPLANGRRVGYKRRDEGRAPLSARRAHDPSGHLLQPATEVMIVVDDSPGVDHEIFETGEFESDDWVLDLRRGAAGRGQARRADRALPGHLCAGRRAARGRRRRDRGRRGGRARTRRGRARRRVAETSDALACCTGREAQTDAVRALQARAARSSRSRALPSDARRARKANVGCSRSARCSSSSRSRRRSRAPGAAAHARAASKPTTTKPTVSSALASLQRSGQITRPVHAVHRHIHGAKRSLSRLSGTRRAELGVVLANVEAMAAAG